jgi:hypothetical protein
VLNGMVVVGLAAPAWLNVPALLTAFVPHTTARAVFAPRLAVNVPSDALFSVPFRNWTVPPLQLAAGE